MENVRSTWAAGAEAIGTDADEAFDEAVRQLDLVLAQAGAAVTRGHLPRVGVGHERLVQVFRNLLDNSAKYRGDAPLRIEAQATEVEGMWRITLRDNGVGFPSEDAERLFEDGERLDASAHIGGQGLGLRLCRDLLAVDGGAIHAQGTPGAGAAFTLTLPAA